MKTAYFSLGCFWSPQLEFEKIQGVKNAEVGYCGGNDPDTTYEKVCSGSTNHAETVKVNFDEKIISYEELVKFFFKIHDPTQINRQGPDIGSQYRSEIFYVDETKKKTAENVRDELKKKLKGKIATNISKQHLYQPAENYHQYYLKKRGAI